MSSSPPPKSPSPSSSSVLGVKRAAPLSLLPAFESFLSSSPGLPRPSKRLARVSPAEQEAAIHRYPTPIPTSSTCPASSSPSQLASSSRRELRRTQSFLSERAPLSTLPTIDLPADGSPVLLGRSSTSSHYRLSANRLISRVHVRASYVPASCSLEAPGVELVCMGWNGVKVHSQGRTWDLCKGDTFTSKTDRAELMLDVHDARIMICWPKKGASLSAARSSWDDDSSPTRLATQLPSNVLQASPFFNGPVLRSPVSPSPAALAASSAFLPSEASNRSLVQVYEDKNPSIETYDASQPTDAHLDKPLCSGTSFESSQSPKPQEFSDQDEENDPIIHSFGPFGENLLPRMAAFSASDNLISLHRSPTNRANRDSEPATKHSTLVNHVVNQLAFSRISSTPLPTIWQTLPVDLKQIKQSSAKSYSLTKAELKNIIESEKCIGVVCREGKDAAGKPLESEYYYVPDQDEDEKRREAVVQGIRKPGLRACRKQHKVWLVLSYLVQPPPQS
ncbi:MAG: hypothetical protein M1829_005495 [Trizodia sp. TS-e1964]|nr:MAG: hypothetical protein M1829_005495 [Trizodia sp. TS-e1964]